MSLELLDRLEDKVDLCVAAMRDARAENETLRGEAQDLERKIEALSRDLHKRSASSEEVGALRSRCTDLERKLDKVRRRIEGLVDKLKSLEA
jgi:FtsZ-binding cell division protein ZapB